MDFRFLLSRIRYIILSPATAWKYISEENRPIRYVRDSFFLPLVILITLSAFIGSLLFANSTMPAVYSVMIALKQALLHIVVVFSAAAVFGEITKALDLGRDYTLSFKMIAYSLAPFFLCQVVSLLFESLIFINILSLYGLYIFWTGANKMLTPPEHKKMPMLVATFVTVAGFYIAASVALSSIIDRIYFAFFA